MSWSIISGSQNNSLSSTPDTFISTTALAVHATIFKSFSYFDVWKISLWEMWEEGKRNKGM